MKRIRANLTHIIIVFFTFVCANRILFKVYLVLLITGIMIGGWLNTQQHMRRVMFHITMWQRKTHWSQRSKFIPPGFCLLRSYFAFVEVWG